MGKLVLKFLSNKVAGLKGCNVIKRRLQHRRFFLNVANFSGTLFTQNISKIEMTSTFG